MNYYKDLRLDELGISSDEEAEELEYELDLRFEDFSPKDRKTWLLQNVYLEQFSRTGTIDSAAREAGVTIYTAQRWQHDDVLGFTRRHEVATITFKGRIQRKALLRASDPNAPATLLIELLRSYIPEQFSRSGHKPDAPKPDDVFRGYHEGARREKDAGYPILQRIAQGDSDPFRNREDTPHNVNLSPAEEDIPHSYLSPAGEATPHSNLSPAGEEIQRGGSSHHDQTLSPNRHSRAGGNPQGAPAVLVPSVVSPSDRHTSEGRYPQDGHPTSHGSYEDGHATTWPDIDEGFDHDDYQPSDVGDPPQPGPTRAERRARLRQQRKEQKKNTFPVKRF